MTALRAVQPLEKLRQGLHVSVSQINSYLLCPENYGESGVMWSSRLIYPALLALPLPVCT